jgi:heme exporter protein D
MDKKGVSFGQIINYAFYVWCAVVLILYLLKIKGWFKPNWVILTLLAVILLVILILIVFREIKNLFLQIRHDEEKLKKHEDKKTRDVLKLQKFVLWFVLFIFVIPGILFILFFVYIYLKYRPGS